MKILYIKKVDKILRKSARFIMTDNEAPAIKINVTLNDVLLGITNSLFADIC
jgi:hypothetical protein